MYLSDKNMLKIIDQLKASGEIKYKTHAYSVMGLDTMRVDKIKNPDRHKANRHFSADDIRVFCEHFKINANFVYGLESNMYRK